MQLNTPYKIAGIKSYYRANPQFWLRFPRNVKKKVKKDESEE